METVCAACLQLNCVAESGLCPLSRCSYCGHNLCNGHVIEATGDVLDKLLQDELPLVVDFSAPWCRPCRAFAPVFADIAAERGSTIRFVNVNVDTERDLIQRFRICGIPTIIIFRNRQVLDILSGVEPKSAFIHWLDSTLMVGATGNYPAG